VSGLNERGFFNNNLLLVEAERLMMRAADEVIVVADRRNSAGRALLFVSAGRVDHLVVDSDVSLPAGEGRIGGIQLWIASPDGSHDDLAHSERQA